MFNVGKGLKIALLLAALLVGAGSAFGQSSTGTLRGQVQDVLGGLVVGAPVTATDAAGVARNATTDEQGQFTFAALPPGRYSVQVNAPGFELYDEADVEVTAGTA